jgi:hypothetical protein
MNAAVVEDKDTLGVWISVHLRDLQRVRDDIKEWQFTHDILDNEIKKLICIHPSNPPQYASQYLGTGTRLWITVLFAQVWPAPTSKRDRFHLILLQQRDISTSFG